eukprot:3177870-Lingulodinium_polyedra.AAC.1
MPGLPASGAGDLQLGPDLLRSTVEFSLRRCVRWRRRDFRASGRGGPATSRVAGSCLRCDA